MTTAVDTSSDELARVAEDAYLFGFPIVMMEVTRRITTNVPAGVKPGFGPMSLFTHMQAFPPGDFEEVVRPNFDTLYSILWFDLRDEPIVISVPDTAGRYYMLPFMDMWSDVFTLIGRRTTGTAAGHYALVGPGWSGTRDGADRRADIDRLGDRPNPDQRSGRLSGRPRGAGGLRRHAAVGLARHTSRRRAWRQIQRSTWRLRRSTRSWHCPASSSSSAPPSSWCSTTPTCSTNHSLARMRRLGLVAGERFERRHASRPALGTPSRPAPHRRKPGWSD